MLRVSSLLLSSVLVAAALTSSLVSSACASPADKAAQTTASLPAPGSPAPDFTAPDQTGTARSLESFRGKPLVLFFYPRDGTPGCTKEACAFRDAWSRYEAAGVNVVGVSTNDIASHAAFAAEHKLPFPLLADTNEVILRAYGVPSTMGFAQRVSVLIDATGTVVRVFPDVDPGVHADEVLRAASSAPPTATTTAPAPATTTGG